MMAAAATATDNYKVISPSALIEKFQFALDNHWGYIYGMTHVMWTEARQKQYNQAKKNVKDCQNSIKYGSRWYGHYVTDCSGLFSWSFSQLGGYMYHGSNTMYKSYCTKKGKLKNGQRSDGAELKPGTAIFTGTENSHGHVALYIGSGYVIEAKGAQYGVVKSKVTESRWTYWGELKGVDYGVSPTPTPTPTPTPEKGYAIVTCTNLALREGPSTNCKVITRAPTGSKVKIKDPPSEWEYVEYNGKSGYMMKKYLNEG